MDDLYVFEDILKEQGLPNEIIYIGKNDTEKHYNVKINMGKYFNNTKITKYVTITFLEFSQKLNQLRDIKINDVLFK